MVKYVLCGGGHSSLLQEPLEPQSCFERRDSQVAQDGHGQQSYAGDTSSLGAHRIYRGLGGCGFGTPVVSYAPRPMFASVDSLMIIKATDGLGATVSMCSTEESWDGRGWEGDI